LIEVDVDAEASAQPDLTTAVPHASHQQGDRPLRRREGELPRSFVTAPIDVPTTDTPAPAMGVAVVALTTFPEMGRC